MTTNKLPLVRLSSINPFLLRLQRQDAESLLAGHDLPTQVPASADLFVSTQAIYQLVEQSAELAGDRFFGFTIGRQTNPADWAPLAAAIDASATLGGMLSRFIVNAAEHSTSTAFYLNVRQNRATFGFEREVIPAISPAQNDAFYLGLLSALLMSATEAGWDNNKVMFTVAEPNAIPTSEEKLRVVPGDKLGMRVSFPTSWLLETLSIQVTKQRDSVMHLHAPDSIVDAVRMALRPHLQDRQLDVARAAEVCGIERRRLSRALHKQGTSVRQVIGELRCEQAQRELVESNKRIREIGESIGFNDAAVFSRAFKNWTGQSPLHYRQSRRD